LDEGFTRIHAAYSEHFKLLAYSLLSDFAERHGRHMDDAETNEMIRWLATEAFSLGGFVYGRADGSMESALDYVREEFLRGIRSKTSSVQVSASDAVAVSAVSDAVTQESLGGWTRSK
jgi:hypothetical protein